MANDGMPTLELEQHPRRDDLARLMRTVALSAADERRARFADGLEELLREAQLAPEDGRVGTFNVLKALQRAEPPVADGRRVLGTLLARGIALDPPADIESSQRVAEALAWLAAHSYLDALSTIDEVLDEQLAARLWRALATLVRDADLTGAVRGRAEALAAIAALSASPSAAAREACNALSREVGDALLARASTTKSSSPTQPPETPAPVSAPLRGEIVAAPLGPLGLFLWCASGLILLRYLGRFVARVLLRCRRPAELTVAGGGVTVDAKLDVLGRTVREQHLHIPVANLASAVREVRYPRLAMYAGLGALAVGTFVGVSLITDAARAGSPSLLALGAIIFGLGIACDLVLSSLWPTKKGEHRVVFVPRKGRTLALAVEDVSAADAALKTLEHVKLARPSASH